MTSEPKNRVTRLATRILAQAMGPMFHGSDSEQITGPIRVNERDAGWFGQGFYVTSDPEYAGRWGKYIYQVAIPPGQYSNVTVVGNYTKINFDEPAEEANQAAGGNAAWIENEHAWAKAFTDYLKSKGFAGVRVHMDQHPDIEVVIFDPNQVKIIGRHNQ